MPESSNNNWFQRLQGKWKVSALQAILILIVFACTGTTVLFIKAPLLNLIVGEEQRNIFHSILYFILVLPIYNVFLLIYGFLFGQFKFFWEFEKRFFNRLRGKKNG